MLGTTSISIRSKSGLESIIHASQTLTRRPLLRDQGLLTFDNLRGGSHCRVEQVWANRSVILMVAHRGIQRACGLLVNRKCELRVHVGYERRRFLFPTLKNIPSTYFANERQFASMHCIDCISESDLPCITHNRSNIDRQTDVGADYVDCYKAPWSSRHD